MGGALGGRRVPAQASPGTQTLSAQSPFGMRRPQTGRPGSIVDRKNLSKVWCLGSAPLRNETSGAMGETMGGTAHARHAIPVGMKGWFRWVGSPVRWCSLHGYSTSVSSPSQGRRNEGRSQGQTARPSAINTLPERQGQRGRFGNKMGTGLAISAQCGYNVRAFGQYRNCLAFKAFKYHRNVFPIPQVWQTYRTQNPVRPPAT